MTDYTAPLADMRGVVAELVASDGMQSLATRLEEDIAALERALDWILASGRDRLAAATVGAGETAAAFAMESC